MLPSAHEHTNRCWWNGQEARWVCPAQNISSAEPSPAKPEPGAERALVDVRDMIVVHTALLREFRLAPAAVSCTTAGDHRRARTVAAHLRFLCDLLHHHHEGEDSLLWPKLRARTSGTAHDAIDEVESQHTQIDAALARVHELRDAWRADPDTTLRDQFAAELTALHAALVEHLDLEERALLPLAASVLTDDEWHAVGEHAIATMSKAELAMSFGMFAYEGDPAVLREMLAAAPLPVRKLLPRIAPHLYARRARAIHGTAHP